MALYNINRKNYQFFIILFVAKVDIFQIANVSAFFDIFQIANTGYI